MNETIVPLPGGDFTVSGPVVPATYHLRPINKITLSPDSMAKLEQAGRMIDASVQRMTAAMQLLADRFAFELVYGAHSWAVETSTCRRCGLTAEELVTVGYVPCARPRWPIGFSVPAAPMKGRITEIRL